jgi:hypothetical protein
MAERIGDDQKDGRTGDGEKNCRCNNECQPMLNGHAFAPTRKMTPIHRFCSIARGNFCATVIHQNLGAGSADPCGTKQKGGILFSGRNDHIRT